MDTLEELDWCLDQLETIQTHRSVSDMASSKVITYYQRKDHVAYWVRVMVFNATLFQFIVAVGFIGGGNGSTRRKPLIYRKSLTTFST